MAVISRCFKKLVRLITLAAHWVKSWNFNSSTIPHGSIFEPNKILPDTHRCCNIWPFVVFEGPQRLGWFRHHPFELSSQIPFLASNVNVLIISYQLTLYGYCFASRRSGPISDRAVDFGGHLAQWWPRDCHVMSYQCDQINHQRLRIILVHGVYSICA